VWRFAVVCVAACSFGHGANNGDGAVPSEKAPDVPLVTPSFVKAVSIHATGAGADVVDFPMLFEEAGDADLKAHAAIDGSDLVFTDTSGNRLPVELESYDPATGAITAWVRVPVISSGAAVTVDLGYGTPQQPIDATAVWSAGFAGVYHFSETAAGAVRDSSANHRDGTMMAMPTPGVDGQIGRAIQIAHNGDYVTLGDTMDFPNNTSWTVSFWTRAATSMPASSLYARIVARLDYNVSSGIVIMQHGTSGEAEVNRDIANTQLFASDVVALPTASFRYEVARYDGAQLTMFGDGMAYPGAADVRSMPVIHKELSIGCDIYGGTPGDTYLGVIDELRFSDRARPQAWIAVEYANQSAPAAFYDVGPEVAK
jgi:hypothetical protein